MFQKKEKVPNISACHLEIRRNRPPSTSPPTLHRTHRARADVSDQLVTALPLLPRLSTEVRAAGLRRLRGRAAAQRLRPAAARPPGPLALPGLRRVDPRLPRVRSHPREESDRRERDVRGVPREPVRGGAARLPPRCRAGGAAGGGPGRISFEKKLDDER